MKSVSLFGICLVALSGCATDRYVPATKPEFASGSQPRKGEPASRELRSILYSESCPFGSRPEGGVESLGKVVGDIFFTGLANDAVAQLVDALNEAAAADRNGFSVTGRSSDYFYGYSKTDGDAGIVQAPKCLVIAEGIPAVRINEAVFCSSDSEDTDYCGGSYAAANTMAGRLMLRDASFYAEIRLTPADTRDAIRGQLAYLWYPAPFVKKRQDERNLTISVRLRKPNASAGEGETASTLLFHMEGVVPGVQVATERLLSAGVWTGVPVFPSKDAIATLVALHGGEKSISGKKMGLAPVNIEATITEKWRPNGFLQAMSRIFGSDASKAKLQTAVQALVVPSQRDAADAAASDSAFKAVQAYRDALVAAITARSTYLTKCLEADAAPEKPLLKLAEQSAYVGWEKAAATLRNAAELAGEELGPEATPQEGCP